MQLEICMEKSEPDLSFKYDGEINSKHIINSYVKMLKPKYLFRTKQKRKSFLINIRESLIYKFGINKNIFVKYSRYKGKLLARKIIYSSVHEKWQMSHIHTT